MMDDAVVDMLSAVEEATTWREVETAAIKLATAFGMAEAITLNKQRPDFLLHKIGGRGMTQITLEAQFDDALLLCPCGSTYLHHTSVTTYDRNEDADTVVKTVTENGETKTSVTDGDGNPSSRRHGLAIEMYCEVCTDVRQLCIAQHKGQTFLSWRITGTREDPDIMMDERIKATQAFLNEWNPKSEPWTYDDARAWLEDGTNLTARALKSALDAIDIP